jgi:acetylornithine deacetylase
MHPDELRAVLASRLAGLLAGSGLELEVRALFPGVPPLETPTDSAIVRAAERLTGQEAGAVAFGTEAPFLNQLGMETVILGPGDIAQAHQPDEYLAMDRIQPTVTLLRRLIERFCVAG